MANDEVIGPRKTMFVLVIVVGCFAVLWPRILSPLVLGPTRDQIQPNQFDREAGCCEVIFDSDVAVLELVNEVCSSALGVGTLSQTAAECRKAVNDTCGVDIAVFLKRNENVGKTTKTLVETMQNSNSSCLREHFGVPVYSLGPHLASKSWDIKDTLKQERATVMRGMGPHPALRERGRAIPPAPPGPPPPARTVTLPPHVRVRSPLSVYYEVEQPPPIPGMRPPLGSPGGPAPAQRSSMGFVMPIYTICIIVFFVYTLSKILFRRTASPYDPVTPDPQFRRRVFRDDSRTSPDKLGKKEADTIVTAISGLVAEVQQQMEASYAQNQQRQDAQDNARPYTNGTILLNTGPVQIVASEFKEASNEKTPEPVNENETTPEPKETEPTKVYKEPSPEVDEMITEAVVSPKESSPNVEEPIPELEPTIVPKEATYETVVDKASTPEPTVTHKGTESVLEPKESTPEPLIPEQSIPEPIPQFSNTVLKHDTEDESIPSSDLTESGPQAEVLPEPNVVKETIDTTQTSDYRELSPGDIQPTPESKELSPELKEISPESKELSPELKEISPEVNEQSPELKEISPEVNEQSPESKEISPEVNEQSPESKEISPEVNEQSPESKEISPEANEQFPELKEISPEDNEQSPELKEISPEVNEQSLELNDVSLELTETSLEPFPETLLEPEQSPHEPKQDAPVTSSPKETSPEPIEQYLSKPNEDPTDSEIKESEAEMQISDHQALITSEHLDHITDIQSTPDLLDNSHVDNLDDAPIVKRSEESQITEHSSEIDSLIELSSDTKGTLELKEPNSQFKESTPDPKVIEEPKSTQIDDNVPVTNQTLLDLEEAIADVEDTIQPEKIPSDLNVEHPKESVEATDTDNNVSEDEEISKEKEEESKVDDKDLKEDRFVLVRRTPDESYDGTDDDDVENAAVKVVGMETTAHPADGGAWPRDQRPPAPASPPPRTPHEAAEVQSIYLQTEIPQQSRVLVAQFEEDRAARPARPADHAPLVVSGKMTLSLIQDAPRETPERDPESTLDEFTTASAVTQPAAEKGELESDEEIEEEIEVEEIELEEEEEEEEEEDDEDVPPPKAAAKK